MSTLMATFADALAAVTCRRATSAASAADLRLIASMGSADSCLSTATRPGVAAEM
nr:hypothetical protein [Streptomyces melanosporofaciens]